MDWDDFLATCIPEPATINVKAYEGSGAYGDVYAEAVDVEDCVIEATRRLVRVQTQDAAGEQAVSSTTVYAPPGTVVPAGSMVTLPSGVVAKVLAVSDLDAHGHDLPDHVELALE